MGFHRYKYGMVIGRFQPFHHGHECIIARALDECDYVVVIIGSAQESRLPHNPLTAEERISMIKECFCDKKSRLIFLPLEDRPTVNNDSSWGEYMMNAIQNRCGVFIDVVFEGRENCRKDWYDAFENIDIIQINRRDEAYSATDMRKALLENNKRLFHAWCANGTEHYYEKLRAIMLEIMEDRNEK